jgi:myosin heavy subunit
MNHSSTVEQLRCAGVVAAVTISRSAFPNRLEHRAVLERFKSLWPKEAGRSEECNIEERSKTDVDTLLTSALNDLEVKKGEKTIKAFVIGRSRAYFRAGALEFLENKRLDGMTFWAVEIQKTIRGFLERRRFQKKGQASVRIEAQVRRFLAKRHYEQLRQRTTQLQSWFRCLHAKRVLVLKRTFSQATKIQVQWKIHKARANLRMHQQAASTIQRFARGMIQRPKYRRALQDKKDESDMKKRLEKRQRELEEAELRAKEEIEQERKEARRQIEEERMKLFEDKRARKLEQEQRESKMEKDLQELKELVALQAKMASQSGHVNNVSPKNSAGEPEVKVVEVVKYVEKGMDNAGPIMTQEQQALMEESGKIIEFLRKENTKLRKKNEVMRNDFKALKENNQRLMEANASAGQSFTALNDHAKQLNGTNQKLLKTVAQYKQKIAQLNGDMNSRQSYYREIASAYKTESEVRAFYEKAILDIFDMASSDRSLTSLQNMVRAKAAECAAVSKRLAVSAPDLEESDSSS